MFDHMRSARIYGIFWNNQANDRIFEREREREREREKEYLAWNMCSDFIYKFYLNLSPKNSNSATYCHKVM